MITKCLVIGIGSSFRSDDAVGLIAAAELRKRDLPDSVEVVDGGTDELGLIEHLRRADSVVIVDAVSIGEAPGTIQTFLVNDTENDNGTSHHRDTEITENDTKPFSRRPCPNVPVVLRVSVPLAKRVVDVIPCLRKLGLHGFGLTEAIGIAARLGTLPRIAIVGIQPESTAPGEGLSDTVKSRIPDLVEAALRAVDQARASGVRRIGTADGPATGG